MPLAAALPRPTWRHATPVQVQEVLRPFLMVCETKNARLVTLALGSLQKMLAHDAVNSDGRKLIMQALVQVRNALPPARDPRPGLSQACRQKALLARW